MGENNDNNDRNGKSKKEIFSMKEKIMLKNYEKKWSFWITIMKKMRQRELINQQNCNSADGTISSNEANIKLVEYRFWIIYSKLK